MKQNMIMKMLLTALMFVLSSAQAADFTSAFTQGKAPSSSALQKEWFCYEDFPNTKDASQLVTYLMNNYEVSLKFTPDGVEKGKLKGIGTEWMDRIVGIDSTKDALIGRFQMFPSLESYELVRQNQSGDRLYLEMVVHEIPAPTFSEKYPPAQLIADGRINGKVKECISSGDLIKLLASNHCKVEKPSDFLLTLYSSARELTPSNGPSNEVNFNGVDLKAERLKNVEIRRKFYYTNLMKMCGNPDRPGNDQISSEIAPGG